MKKTFVDILISVCMCIIGFSVLVLINLLLVNFIVDLGFIVFLISLSLLVAVLIADTIFIKKWYFFLICTLPLSIQPAYSAFQVYQIYNNDMYSQTNLSSTEILILFVFLHLSRGQRAITQKPDAQRLLLLRIHAANHPL